MHSSDSWFARFLAGMPMFSCDALVCLTCGQLVVKGDYVHVVKSFWVRLKYGVSWVTARITGEEQAVTIQYNYSFWAADLAQYTGEDVSEEEDITRIDLSEK